MCLRRPGGSRTGSDSHRKVRRIPHFCWILDSLGVFFPPVRLNWLKLIALNLRAKSRPRIARFELQRSLCCANQPFFMFFKISWSSKCKQNYLNVIQLHCNLFVNIINDQLTFYFLKDFFFKDFLHVPTLAVFAISTFSLLHFLGEKAKLSGEYPRHLIQAQERAF